MDVKALKASLADAAQVKACGQVWKLKAPGLDEALRMRREFQEGVPEAAEERTQHYVDTGIKCIMATLGPEAKVPKALVEQVVVRTGIFSSPLLQSAMMLCGMWMMEAEEDADLPT